jgi:two-component system CheB/CheR fusion protein
VVIDDNRDTAESLRLLLELFGHQARTAYTGPEGVEAVRQARPDVVLCDLGLPGMDGLAVARALRQDPATAGVRLIAMSGFAGDEDRARSCAAGFGLHLNKPTDPAELQRVLAAMTPDPGKAGGAPE